MFIRDWDEVRFDSEEEAFDDAGYEMLPDYGEDYLLNLGSIIMISSNGQ